MRELVHDAAQPGFHLFDAIYELQNLSGENGSLLVGQLRTDP
jgi:hypothetical protein